MGSAILPDDLLSQVSDLERRIRILEVTSRTGLGLPQGPLVASLATDFDFGTTQTDVAGLAVTITVGERRRLRIAFHAHVVNIDFLHAGGNNTAQITIAEGATELARRTRPQIADSSDSFGSNQVDIDGEVFVTPTAGTHTYKLTARITHGMSQNMAITGLDSGDPAYISVEDVGMVPT